MNIIEQLELEQRAKLTADKKTPVFAPGDTVKVSVKVIEGARERLQAFEGVVIARKNAGLNSAFTVRKISYGEGVERVFPLFSPNVASVEVVRRGDVRRAKLYYLRDRRGKSARIAEKTDGLAAKLTAADKAEARRLKEERDRHAQEAAERRAKEAGEAKSGDGAAEAGEAAATSGD